MLVPLLFCVPPARQSLLTSLATDTDVGLSWVLHTQTFWASKFPAVCQALGSGLNSTDRGSPSFQSCSVGKLRLRVEGTSPSLSHTVLLLESGTQELA